MNNNILYTFLPWGLKKRFMITFTKYSIHQKIKNNLQLYVTGIMLNLYTTRKGKKQYIQVIQT